MFQSVDSEIASGRAWRAKEILEGHIRNSPYSPALYERHGQILLSMQDTLNAGRFFFLSGVFLSVRLTRGRRFSQRGVIVALAFVIPIVAAGLLNRV